MSGFLSPTKGNLINLKRSLKLSKIGYELMDKKRNILIREMMPLIEVAKSIQNKVKTTFNLAYSALEKANTTIGISTEFSETIKIETGVFLEYKNIMGISIPKITLKPSEFKKNYSNLKTNSYLDLAFVAFLKAKEVSVVLAEIENSIYLLANEIKETKTRANALFNIVIPNIEKNIKYISDAIEEKEREEFSRLKIIKKTKNK